ncbi:O-acetyltransferase OatA [compost metagenome]
MNSTIKAAVPEFENAKVVDWYAASEGKENYFYKDGVHLKPDGSRYYASLLLQALQEQ